MSVLIVLHEAARTGAPRIGGLIAGALKHHRQVRILCLTGGAMLDWLRERVGAENVHVVETDQPRHKVSFAERLSFAKEFLEQEPSPIVYVNSLAACEFVVAAKAASFWAPTIPRMKMLPWRSAACACKTVTSGLIAGTVAIGVSV